MEGFRAVRTAGFRYLATRSRLQVFMFPTTATPREGTSLIGPPGEPEHPQQDPPPSPPRDPVDPGRPQQPELPPVDPHTPTVPQPRMHG